jgi:hypothetical protein
VFDIHTCGQYSILEICETAHRAITEKMLNMEMSPERQAEIEDHCCHCERCGRWFQNACSHYEQTIVDDTEG